MGTRQLQADRRVAEVTLNEAGKAATLTLASGWTYEGSSGPFNLKNVEHGHQIVRGATADGSVASAPRKRAEPTAVARGVNPEAVEARPLVKPTVPRGDVIWVYRVKLVSEKHNHEIAGWFRWSSDPERDNPDKSYINDKCWELLKGQIPKGRSKEDYKPSWKRWTNKDQANSRKNDELGSPWGSENHGD